MNEEIHDQPMCPMCFCPGATVKADSKKGVQMKCVGCSHCWWVSLDDAIHLLDERKT